MSQNEGDFTPVAGKPEKITTAGKRPRMDMQELSESSDSSEGRGEGDLVDDLMQLLDSAYPGDRKSQVTACRKLASFLQLSVAKQPRKEKVKQ